MRWRGRHIWRRAVAVRRRRTVVGGLAINPATLTGLTNGVAIVGDTIGATGATFVTRAWGNFYGDASYGTGPNPTDFTAAVGGSLFFQGVDGSGNVYRASASAVLAAGLSVLVEDGSSMLMEDGSDMLMEA